MSSDGQCLNGQGLIPLLMTGQNTSLVDTINGYVTGLCAQPVCSNDTLADVGDSLTSGCHQELGIFGFGNASSSQFTGLLQRVYTIILGMVCLEE